jgi:hypothetical protein
MAEDEVEAPEEDLSPKQRKKRGEAYKKIISDIFARHYVQGITEFEFAREEIETSADRLGVSKPKNLGDVVYAFRHRRKLPTEILDTQPPGLHWLILGAGDALYRFRLSTLCYIEPRSGLLVRKVPDATPQIISRYALTDEQALLAKVRYNRLIDLFLGITTYSLQSHLRTKIANYGQIEIDEMYVGIDRNGAHYVIPVQAKGKKDKLGVIQTIQDITFCRSNPKYAGSIVRAVSAQFVGNEIALFELSFDGNDVQIVDERHYILVGEAEPTASELAQYALSSPSPA